MTDEKTKPATSDERPAPRPAAPLPLRAGGVLLPNESLRDSLWPVVACDQYSSEPVYWQRRDAAVGARASTLRLILPEYLLEEKGEEACGKELADIWNCMERYQSEGVFDEPLDNFILTVRRLSDGQTRRNGVVLAVDLEAYDYAPDSCAAFKASERTVESRLPARAAIRARATLELPHVLLLIDDPALSAIEPLAEMLPRQGRALYEIELPEQAGQISGYAFSPDSPAGQAFMRALEALPSYTKNGVLAYVGDGNHSLAAAKRCWEEKKRNHSLRVDDPARFALVELINLHDPGLQFLPIHQLVYDCALSELVAFAQRCFADEQAEFSAPADFETLYPRFIAAQEEAASGHTILLRERSGAVLLTLKEARDSLAVSAAHRLTAALQTQAGKRVDYIHGEAALESLSAEGHVALYLPGMGKSAFFPALAEMGVLPKKTFSLGEAADKRHYMEARRIV